MFDVSKKLFYAVEAVLYIAYNSSHGPISGRDIATRQGLPARYLEALMQKLVRGGILRGIRGPSGGYVLAKERRRISVSDICASLSEQEENDERTATALGHKIVQPLWDKAQAQMMEYLKQATLADLCEAAEQKKIKRAAEEKFDFAI